MFPHHALATGATGYAVVIGGSMAGLLAARVLADYFERVTLVERDRFSAMPGPRKGVPQARHLHVLLMRGQLILQELFPDLVAELQAAGAHLLDAGEDYATLTPHGWGARFRSGIAVLSCTRDLLEWTIRRRLAALPRVHVADGTEVTGLIHDPGEHRVIGIPVRFLGQPVASAASVITADLVVDASGRSSRLPSWLAALDYARPEETVIAPFVGYASRTYRCTTPLPLNWKALIIHPAPPDRLRGGMIYPVEGERWIITLGGRGNDCPPTDEAGFLTFARSLTSPMLYEVLRTAEPLSPITGFRSTENRWRHYERLDHWPEGVVVVGDAACALNPIYGQGMTIAAQGAVTLGESLREQRRRRPAGDLTGLGRGFQARLARINAVPWMLATSEDLRYPTTIGGTLGWRSRLTRRYLARVGRRATESAAVRLPLLQVFHLLQPPATLFRPKAMMRVLGGCRLARSR